MGWNDEEVEKTKKGMNLSSKILLALIFCILLIIILLFVLLMNIQGTSFRIYVDGQSSSSVSKEQLLSTVDNITYVNIEEFAKLVGYEYHLGEYKAYVTENDKCYVQIAEETASFYLNDNKVYKLPMGELEKEYEEYVIDNINRSINDKIYAPIDAISKAFNVVIEETSNSFKVYTLDYLVTLYDAKVISWGYTSILEEEFENKKALLYGLLVVKKEGGLYKIINLDNTKEIALDRYTSIIFSENMQEFYVTNSSKQIGIINLDGTTKIDANYESISLFNKQSDLYLVKQQSKYGIVKGGNITVIFPEYDKIGTSIGDKEVSLMLDTLIPVCKGEKWGAYNKDGRMVLSLQYDGFGYDFNTVTIDGIKKSVQPLLTIERCEGIVVRVKKDEEQKYGLMSLQGKELVPVDVDAIYELPAVEDEDSKYFMLYKEKELNVIERLIKAGLIEETVKEDEENNIIDNSTGNTIENITITNTVENTNTSTNSLNNINNFVSGNNIE